MTPQALKSSILQLAIQGKLVDQKDTDGSVIDALDLISQKREELIRVGKLKKLGKINKTSEVDLEIPDTWRFVCLSEIICKRVDNRGKTPPHSLIKTKEHCIDLLEINSIVPGASINHDNVEKYISEETYATLRGYIEKDDILIATVGSVGKFAMMDDNRSAIAQNIIAIKCFEEVEQKYIFYLLQTPYFYASMGNITMEAVQASIKVPDLMNLRVPLPPLAEQKRIVAKIEELLPYIDRYEKAWSRLEDFNKRFPVDMQKSILQMAIQGKLVEQRPEEGTGEELYQQIQAEKQKLIKEGKIKKEKPRPEITEEEIPFEIPESWKWCRLNSLGVTQTGNTPSKAHPEYIGTDIPFITPGDILNGQIYYDNQALSLLGKKVARVSCVGSIMQVCIGGSIGKAAIAYREVTFNQQINVISPIACLSEYIFAVMQSEYFITTMKDQAGGTATPIINRGLWDSLLIPLPPLAEQKRIVAKLEEILPLCERLK